jgi:hypothetical protein
LFLLTFVIGLTFFLSFTFIAVGCGQSGSTPSTTNYTIQGKLAGINVAASSVKAAATDTVTHILAAGSNGEIYLASISSDGSFSINLNKGVPYALGFYNKTGSTITLLGYLKQDQVSWESLPLMNPTGSSVDLGTVEVNTGSVEATASIDLTSLIARMNLVDQTTAAYYGEIDGPMAVFTNVDVDGNGEFDCQEGKYYIFQTYVNVANGSGQIANMQNGQYNESYHPTPESYTVVLSAKGDSKSTGTAVTFHFPQGVNTYGGTPSSSVSASVEATTSSDTWTCYSKISNNPIISPEVTPAGNYTIEVGASTYTFQRYQSSSIVAVNSNNGLVYPVFNLVTNESGYITTVNYKWKKLTNGVIGNATAGALAAAVEDTALSTAFVHTSPFISFFSGAQTLIGSIIKFSRDGSSLDVSSYNIKLPDIHHIQASYNLTSRVVCKFDLY